MNSAAIQRACRVIAELLVDGLRHLASGLEVRGLKTQGDAVALQQGGGYGALNLCTARYSSGTEVIDLNLAATGRRSGTAHYEVALGERVNLSIGAFEWRSNQHATFERL